MLIWLSMLQNAIPEAIAVLLTIAIGMGTGELPLQCVLFLIYSVLLRLVWNSSILIHGFGHSLAIAIVDCQLSALNITNLLEHRSIIATLKSLLPFNAIFIPCFDTSSGLWITAGDSTSWRIRIKALGGILFNLLAVAFIVIRERRVAKIIKVASKNKSDS